MTDRSEISDNETPRYVAVRRQRGQSSRAEAVLRMLANRVHAMDTETGQVVCAAGEGEIQWEHQGHSWSEENSPNRCP